jgi:hypothetical protein
MQFLVHRPATDGKKTLINTYFNQHIAELTQTTRLLLLLLLLLCHHLFKIDNPLSRKVIILQALDCTMGHLNVW